MSVAADLWLMDGEMLSAKKSRNGCNMLAAFEMIDLANIGY